MNCFRAVLAAVLLAGPVGAAAAPSARPPHIPDTIKMVLDLFVTDNVMNIPVELAAGKARLDWHWLAARHGVKPNGAIPRKLFKGPPDLFAILDRDGDGAIRPDDFDWSPSSMYLRQKSLTDPLFRRLNAAGDGKLTEKEWAAAFARLAGKKGHLTPDDLRRLVFPPANFRGPMPGFVRPNVVTRLLGIMTGEQGSLCEGPLVGEDAPDFTLSTPDEKQTMTLSSFKGKKPVVLVFGNYTCPPYRGTYSQVDAVGKRHAKSAAFLGVYVREAHAADGWWPIVDFLNDVNVKQPRTDGERREVARVCLGALKMSMPLLVDGIDDPVGHAYSGMPSRLYVIGTDGKVAFKSGRGPFGFRPGQMEQALALELLAAQYKAREAGR